VRLLRRCLERDAKKRLRDIGEARIALDTLGAEPEPSTAAPAAPAKRSAMGAIAWAVAAVATAIAAIAIVAILKKPAPDVQVTKFEVAGDPKLTTAIWPRISPDGRTLAYMGRDAAGKTTIWVRPLDAFESHQLQDTETASRFFWSPDSRFVAFFTQRSQLKKAPVAGGPAQLITEAAGGADGTWGATGEILFDGRATDAIRRVGASGGSVVQATTPDPAKGEAGHAWPYFLPDGKHFLFLAMASSAGGKPVLHVGSLDKPGSTVLGPTDSRAEYANGFLVYALNGTLVARRFDPDTLEASGEPIPLAERISVDANNTASFSVSSTGALAFLSGRTRATSQLVWLDRSGKELETIGEPDVYGDLALSPDGSRIAYMLRDKNDSLDIWVRDLKRGVASRLTFGPSDDVWPVWSPDGRRIAYATNSEGGHFIIATCDANGAGAPSALSTVSDGDLAPIDWSKDGRQLALCRLPASRRWDIVLASLDSPPKLTPYLDTEFVEFNPMLSPDGRYIAYSSNESGTTEIYVQTNPRGGGKWQISNGGGVQPRWRPDGRELYYIGPDDTFRAVPVTIGASFEPGPSVALFKRVWERSTTVRNRWTTIDGQHFLVNASINSGNAQPFSVILNWPAAVK
jgi:Tol biopolymer transport system component